MSKYKKDSIVTGTVVGVEKYGVFVKLDKYYSGLIHISEISDSYIVDINDYLRLGDKVKARVINEIKGTHKVRLSTKGIIDKSDKRAPQPIKEVGSGFDVLKSNLKKWEIKKLKEIRKN